MAQTLQIRNVPEELHSAIAERAHAEGLTISQYLLRRIAQIEGKPLTRDALRAHRERIRGKKLASKEAIDRLIREDRER
ncbi:hypothetical protein J5X84_00660 [Streptosporangiaceae bacterium NEAU-GS5]|nr:hypothetical protein [Streptosporangiaceae bacterium NEAU-GS5]